MKPPGSSSNEIYSPALGRPGSENCKRLVLMMTSFDLCNCGLVAVTFPWLTAYRQPQGRRAYELPAEGVNIHACAARVKREG